MKGDDVAWKVISFMVFSPWKKHSIDELSVTTYQ